MEESRTMVTVARYRGRHARPRLSLASLPVSAMPGAWKLLRGSVHPDPTKKISNMKDLLPVRADCSLSSKLLFIIAEEVKAKRWPLSS